MIDCRCGKTRPQARRRSAAVKTGHKPYARRVKGTYDVFQIVRINNDVAVRQDQDVMASFGRQVDQIRDFAIGAVTERIDLEFDIAIGELGDETFNDINRGISVVFHAKHDLDRARIVLNAKAGQIRQKAGFSPMQRFEDGDGWKAFGGRKFRANKSAREQPRGERIDAAANGGRVANDRRYTGSLNEKDVHVAPPQARSVWNPGILSQVGPACTHGNAWSIRAHRPIAAFVFGYLPICA
jgi:hypothetical protein